MTPQEKAMERLAKQLAALNRLDSAMPNKPSKPATDKAKDEKK